MTVETQGLAYEAGIQAPAPWLHGGGEQALQHCVGRGAAPTRRQLRSIAPAKSCIRSRLAHFRLN